MAEGRYYCLLCHQDAEADSDKIVLWYTAVIRYRKTFSLWTFIHGEGKIYKLDNCGLTTTRVPGLDGVPIHYELSPEYRFAYGHFSWRQDPRLTSREIAMLRLMCEITEDPNWPDRVSALTEQTSRQWFKKVTTNPYHDLINAPSWDWCMEELQDKLSLLKATGLVQLYNTGSGVVRSNCIGSSELDEQLRTGFRKLASDSQSTLSDSHPRSRIIDPSLVPLVYGVTKVLRGGPSVAPDDLFRELAQATFLPKPVDPRDDFEYFVKEKLPQLWLHWVRTIDHNRDAAAARWSTTFQWLPCELRFCDNTTMKLRIASYINNVHPQYEGIYDAVAELASAAIEPWNHVLVKDGKDQAPPRILTYGAPDEGHPNPGESFTFQEWKDGKASRPIVPPAQSYEAHQSGHGITSQHNLEDLNRVHEYYTVRLQDEFRRQGLQVIVKTSSIELTPELSVYDTGNDRFHLDGMLNEHIVATARYYYDVKNIANASIQFAQETSIPTDKMDEPEDWSVEEVFDVYVLESPCLGRSAESAQRAHNQPSEPQILGDIPILAGRMIAWPNTLMHRNSSFRLRRKTKPGHLRYVTLHLVDPHYRILSTANVPPQQPSWWLKDAVTAFESTHMGKLPQELRDMIYTYLLEWQMSMDKSKEVREATEQERRDLTRTLVSAQLSTQLYWE